MGKNIIKFPEKTSKDKQHKDYWKEVERKDPGKIKLVTEVVKEI